MLITYKFQVTRISYYGGIRWENVCYSAKYALKWLRENSSVLSRNELVIEHDAFKRYVFYFYFFLFCKSHLAIGSSFMLHVHSIFYCGMGGKNQFLLLKLNICLKKDIIRIEYLGHCVVTIASITVIHTCVLESTGCYLKTTVQRQCNIMTFQIQEWDISQT